MRAGSCRFLALAILFSIAGAARPRRVVIVDIDGVRRDTFEQAYASGRLPNFERILGSAAGPAPFAEALVFDHASTIFPSVTMAAQASIYTGAYPARHGIPGNSWFDTAAAARVDYMAPLTVACVYGISLGLAGCDGGLANNHLASATIYEAASRAGMTSAVVFNQYFKGATRPVPWTISDALQFVRGLDEIDYGAFDVRMMDRAIGSFEVAGLPNILTVYFAGADGVAHALGISSQFDYFSSVIDPQFGRLLDAIAARDIRWRANTLFIVTSDHGRTDAVIHPEDLFLEDAIRAVAARGAGENPPPVVSNDGMAYIYAPADSARAIAVALLREPGLAGVIDSVLVRESPRAPFRMITAKGATTDVAEDRRALIAGADSERAGNIMVLLEPGHYFGNTGFGSHHGSIHTGDLNVPLILAQGGIGASRLSPAVSTTQIAGTIAWVLRIPVEAFEAPLPGVVFNERRRLR